MNGEGSVGLRRGPCGEGVIVTSLSVNLGVGRGFEGNRCGRTSSSEIFLFFALNLPSFAWVGRGFLALELSFLGLY